MTKRVVVMLKKEKAMVKIQRQFYFIILFSFRKVIVLSWICVAQPTSKMRNGVKFRFMFHESLLTRYKPMLDEAPTIEKRTLTAIPGLVFCTEKEAALCLQTLDGRMDYTGFFGKDLAFVNWVKELFEHYWGKANRCIPT